MSVMSMARFNCVQPGVQADEMAARYQAFVEMAGYADEHGAYGAGTWVCYPPGSSHTAVSDGGALMYIRTGGLFDGFGPPR